MATTKWSSFYQYVAPDVYECPELTMDIAIRDAAIEFCRRAHVWKEQLDPIQTAAGVTEYDLSVPSTVIPEHIVEVSFGDRWLVPVKREDLPASKETRQAMPRAYSATYGDKIKLFPTPDRVGELRVTVAFTPSSSASGIDSTIFERYKEIIAHGAKFRLLAVPSKSWSNPEAAQYHRQQFYNGINEARIRNDNGMSNTVAYRRFA